MRNIIIGEIMLINIITCAKWTSPSPLPPTPLLAWEVRGYNYCSHLPGLSFRVPVCVCVCVRVRSCVSVCVFVCVRACVRVCALFYSPCMLNWWTVCKQFRCDDAPPWTKVAPEKFGLHWFYPQMMSTRRNGDLERWWRSNYLWNE